MLWHCGAAWLLRVMTICVCHKPLPRVRAGERRSTQASEVWLLVQSCQLSGLWQVHRVGHQETWKDNPLLWTHGRRSEAQRVFGFIWPWMSTSWGEGLLELCVLSPWCKTVPAVLLENIFCAVCSSQHAQQRGRCPSPNKGRNLYWNNPMGEGEGTAEAMASSSWSSFPPTWWSQSWGNCPGWDRLDNVQKLKRQYISEYLIFHHPEVTLLFTSFFFPVLSFYLYVYQ